MNEDRYDKGGYLPGGTIRVRMWHKDGLVSFDGPNGPWGRIITAEEIKTQ
jgi:hypothetical protein